jgi:uncharacterized damage-inducible protein DinB
VPALLQPVAHALQQAREEARAGLRDFPDERLWDRPAGVASVGFHLQHIAGVIDRLFTYARSESLSDAQLAAREREGSRPASAGGLADLLDGIDARVALALNELRSIEPQTLTDTRLVGRQKLPSTRLGLLFHAAEHVQRHIGQLLVTARVLRGDSPLPDH